MRASDGWHALYRVGIGLFWLYFASQKWQGVGWMHGLMVAAARANPIPGLHELLVQVVVPNWELFAICQAVGETVVGIALVLGLATRKAAVLGFLLSLNLALTVAFAAGDLGFRWLYYLAVLANAELVFSEPGVLALGRARFVPGWLRD